MVGLRILDGGCFMQIVVGDTLVHDQGRLTALGHPDVLAIAAKYTDRPGLDPE